VSLDDFRLAIMIGNENNTHFVVSPARARASFARD
jgi:hypothetical protein